MWLLSVRMSLGRFWERYQWNLHHRPYITNAATGSLIAIFGDTLAQTVFKDWSGQTRTRRCPCEPQDDDVGGPSTHCKAPHFIRKDDHSVLIMTNADGSIVDFRRSLIFASFTALFGTPFWLKVYKHIDRMIPKVTIKTAIQKGILSWFVANSTTPLFIAYITTLDRWCIRKEGFGEYLRGPHYVAPRKVLQRHDGLSAVMAKVRRDLPVMMSYSICFWSIQWIPMFYLLPPQFRLVYVSFLQIVWSGVTSYLLHRSDPEERVGGIPS